MQLRHAALTDAGRTRDHNEDSYGIEPGNERAASGALFVVCDGVGGFESGEVASELAVETILRSVSNRPDEPPEQQLRTAFRDANQAVLKKGRGKIGTTGVAALFGSASVVLANVGDCRAYLVRDGQARQITRDHSFVAEQIAAGMLTEAQARQSAYRHVITRAIGQGPTIEVDTFREALRRDDIVVLCSDGLHGQAEPDEIALAVTRVPLDEACRALVRLANERGGPDNITIVAIRVEHVAPAEEPTAPPGRPGHSSEQATVRLDAADAAHAAGPTGTARLDSASARTRGSAQPRRARFEPQRAAPAGAARSFVLWMAGLLLLAALLIGGYVYLVADGAGRVEPASIDTPALAPPTQTPPGAQPTSTLVPAASP